MSETLDKMRAEFLDVADNELADYLFRTVCEYAEQLEGTIRTLTAERDAAVARLEPRRYRTMSDPETPALPCPFCGLPPETIPWTKGQHAVTCEHVECFVKPHYIGEIREATVKRWNKRWNKRRTTEDRLVEVATRVATEAVCSNDCPCSLAQLREILQTLIPDDDR